MLTIVMNQNATAAKEYFNDALLKSDYYVNDQEMQGIFGGRLGARLGLKGEVTKEVFYDLCDNIHPLHRTESLTPETRAERTVFYDCVFGCSKSVSIAHALSKDGHIMEAFRESVHATLSEMEADSQTRVRIDGKHENRKTNELLYAEFIHQTARPVGEQAPDPHLHAHITVFNVAYDNVEKRTKALQFREIKRNAILYQSMFHKHMADRLQAMGYEVRKTKEAFEIVGIPQAAIDHFSKRTKQIEKIAKEKGVTNAKEKAELGARTRGKKQKGLTMDELKEEWRRQIIEHNIEADTIRPVRFGTPQSGDILTPEKCISHAIADKFERASVVNEKRVMAEAIQHSIGSRFASVETIKDHFNRDERLIRIEENGVGKCTTKEVLTEEMEMIALSKKGLGVMQPLFKNCPQTNLEGQQKLALEHLMTTKDRVSIVRGAAGAGKTTMMKEALKHFQDADKKVFAVAPSTDASRGNLRDEGFKDATTVAALLQNKKEHHKLKDQVLLVDEAGMLGNAEMKSLLDLSNTYNTRLVFIGDTRQHSSVSRGDALRLLNKVGNIPVAEVSKIYRQKKYHYRKAIEHISKGEIEDGFKQLDDIGFIKGIDPEKPYHQLVSDYLTALKAKKSALVISPTHREGEAVSNAIRQAMRREKMIGAAEVTIEKLVNTNMTQAQKADWRNFRQGQVIQFNRKSHGVGQGSIWKIAGITDNYISLKDDNGKTASLPLGKPNIYEVFESRQMAISKGDKIRITRTGTADRKKTAKLEDYLKLYTNKKNNGKPYKRTVAKNNPEKIQINNGQLLEVASLGKGGKIELKTPDGKARYLIDRDFRHLTHAHCITSHASQGKTTDRVMVYQPASTFDASNDKQFYVSASRAREMAIFYTDDKQGLLENVKGASDRQSAIELSGKLKQHEHFVLQQERNQPTRQIQPENTITKGVKRAKFEDRDYEPRL